jgi:hypothetical protein
MVRIHRVFAILQFIHSPSFQLHCYFRGYRAILDIAAHRWIFAPPQLPSARVCYKRAATQKEW